MKLNINDSSENQKFINGNIYKDCDGEVFIFHLNVDLSVTLTYIGQPIALKYDNIESVPCAVVPAKKVDITF